MTYPEELLSHYEDRWQLLHDLSGSFGRAELISFDHDVGGVGRLIVDACTWQVGNLPRARMGIEPCGLG
jgi:hypothetical protein